jgi:hypothetical protein
MVHAGSGHYEPTMRPKLVPLQADARNFFIEFRGRREHGGNGHAYMVLGNVNGAGRIQNALTFGFAPQTRRDEDLSVWALPVSGMISMTRSDIIARPDSVFRLHLTRSQYEAIAASLAGLEATWTVYSLIGSNCNDFMAIIAQRLGLATPIITLLPPADYIVALKALNGR